MDTKTQTLLPSPSLQCPMSLYQALPGSPCLPSRPSSPHSSSPIPASLPLSPLAPSHSIPLSPTSSPPSALTSQTQAPPTLSPRLSSPPPSRGHDFLCPSLMSPGDQDDLTCLSWLHQRGDLLPLQPLPRTAPLPDLPHGDPFSSHMPPAVSKPPYSFSSLIFMAIEDSPEKRLPVKGIYDWIVKNFPYYRAAPSGWRNSVRHNLSLSKSFRRIHREKGQTVGKGSLWCVCPEYRPALLEVLRKTHHCHSTNRQLYSSPALLEEGDYGAEVMNGGVQITDSLSQTLLSSPSPPALSSDHPSLSSDTAIPLTADQEELVAMETIELQEEVCEEKDPLADSGYIEFHCYQYQQYQYLVLPGETEIDLETVEILQLDAEAQEAAGSLLDLAGGGH